MWVRQPSSAGACHVRTISRNTVSATDGSGLSTRSLSLCANRRHRRFRCVRLDCDRLSDRRSGGVHRDSSRSTSFDGVDRQRIAHQSPDAGTPVSRAPGPERSAVPDAAASERRPTYAHYDRANGHTGRGCHRSCECVAAVQRLSARPESNTARSTQIDATFKAKFQRNSE